jgi:signal transduction histidine kinase
MRDDLTHMLIHDLSNPLAAMQMALEMVQITDGEPDQPLAAGREARDALEIVRRSNQRAQRLVTSLLDISRLESGSVQVEADALRAGPLVETILAELQPWADEHQLALRRDLAADLPAVWADADLLDRVLRNLLGNAIKYTPAGGQITLSICPAAEEARFSVRDTGPGLPARVEEQLFSKFVRGVGPGHGHGLGLAFCKLAVEAMHGRIWAESQPGLGTAFHFTLPLAA